MSEISAYRFCRCLAHFAFRGNRLRRSAARALSFTARFRRAPRSAAPVPAIARCLRFASRLKSASGGLSAFVKVMPINRGAGVLVTIQTMVFLLFVLAGVAVLSARLQIPASILLVITGVALALVPGLPTIAIVPDFILVAVLPPVIYSSAVAMSWREFRFNLRPISLLAVGCVIFTTAATAAAAHLLLGLAWPLGFVLGAIVSPPDALAPLAIARRLQIPRRLLVILEGEGLANDATALILYRFAVAAASVGVFSFSHAALAFCAILGGEIIWGIGVGWLMLRLRRWVRDPRIEITLSVLTPFLAYWPPEHLGGSGVLATVATGLYISWNGLRLISAATRLQGIFFWDFLLYLIEGLVFLVTGLQARSVISGISGYSVSQLALSAALVSAVVIVARFVWVFPSTYLPRWLFPPIRRKDPSPPWQWPFALAFTGVRGIVSLVAALAIPLTTQGGEPFPERDLILFLTFSVMLTTLVGQGLMLPWVIRALGLAHAGRRELRADQMEARKARRLAVKTAAERLDELISENSLSEELAEPLRIAHRDRILRLDLADDGDDRHGRLARLHDEIELQLIEAERKQINDLYRDGGLKAEARRQIERELDLREANLANQRQEE
jgi:CPA1 family monovalent cation:H+ antiporter